jgi:hypothetical protein
MVLGTLVMTAGFSIDPAMKMFMGTNAEKRNTAGMSSPVSGW